MTVSHLYSSSTRIRIPATVWAILLLTSLCFSSAAQEEQAPDPKTPEAESAIAPEVFEPVLIEGGDIIRLKNGRVLSGGQILSSNLDQIEVLLVEGVPPLTIPFSSIESIEEDEYDPAKAEIERMLEAKKVSRKLEGMKLSPAMMEKLRAPLNISPAERPVGSLSVILEALSKRQSVTITLSDKIPNLPPENAAWTFKPTKESTLYSVIFTDLPKAQPHIIITPQEDALLIDTSLDVRATRPVRPAPAPVAASQPVNAQPEASAPQETAPEPETSPAPPRRGGRNRDD